MLIIAGTFTIDPTKVDTAIADAIVMMRATHQEPGNLAYVFSVDPIDPAIIHLYEKWESEEALAAHSASPHMAEFRPKTAGWGIKAVDILKYEIASEGPLR
jgi:quinol monooxygenase YgiN